MAGRAGPGGRTALWSLAYAETWPKPVGVRRRLLAASRRRSQPRLVRASRIWGSEDAAARSGAAAAGGVAGNPAGGCRVRVPPASGSTPQLCCLRVCERIENSGQRQSYRVVSKDEMSELMRGFGVFHNLSGSSLLWKGLPLPRCHGLRIDPQSIPLFPRLGLRGCEQFDFLVTGETGFAPSVARWCRTRS